MNLLVTGGAGFIGSHFVRLATQHGHTCTVIDNFSAGLLSNLQGVDARVFDADIADSLTFSSLQGSFEALVHFAAETHVDRSITDPAAFVRTNVAGTHHALEFVLQHHVPRMLLVSTDEVYGSIDNGEWTEESPLQPRSPYSASKASADLLALSYVTTFGLDVVITRCSNNYGPAQLPEKLIPRFTLALASGQKVPLYGDGLHVRDWLHVEDHVRGLLLALERGKAGRVYNIGGGTEMTNRDVTFLLLKEMGLDEERIDYVQDRPGHDRRYALNWDRARTELGYRPEVTFSHGLAESVQWYLRNPEWVEQAQATLQRMSKAS